MRLETILELRVVTLDTSKNLVAIFTNTPGPLLRERQITR
jgi:hypothetical protein